jgi:hypothetical protein
MRIIIVLVLAGSALLTTDTPKQEAASRKNKLWAAVSVDHPVFNKHVLGGPFMMYFALVNDGPATAWRLGP